MSTAVLEDLIRAMADREVCRERFKEFTLSARLDDDDDDNDEFLYCRVKEQKKKKSPF